jgi:poly-beta-1,6-N-acetyl-D-glucosamine N-deacetylase
MKTKIINITYRLLCRLGLPWLIREVYARRKVTIIDYHDPRYEVFESHARFFASHYNFVSIDQIVEALKKGSFRDLPDKALLITFDDGYAGNAELFPILKHYSIPAVIYMVAGVVDTKRHFWFNSVPSRRSETMKALKSVEDKERRERLRNEYDYWDEKEYETIDALTSEQIKEFVDIKGTIGSHTYSHPLLDHCDEATGYWECSVPREQLKTLAEREILDFALPNGNWNNAVLEWVKRAGYRSCRTIEPHWVTLKTSPMLLPSFGIDDAADVDKATMMACGLWYIFKKSLGKIIALA